MVEGKVGSCQFEIFGPEDGRIRHTFSGIAQVARKVDGREPPVEAADTSAGHPTAGPGCLQVDRAVNLEA
jgi:hypothetical protein